MSLVLSACGGPVAPSVGRTPGPGQPVVDDSSGNGQVVPPSLASAPSPDSTSQPPPPPAADHGVWPLPRWCGAGASGQPTHDDVRLPILYYHRAEDPPADYSTWSAARRHAFITYDTLPGALALQLDWLTTHGYTTILPSDLAAHWLDGCRLPGRPVMLTFDDGSLDWVTTVLPLLRAHGMVAEFYLTLEAVARHNISWADVRTLSANGMGIGAHDVHHVQLAMLGRDRPPADPRTMWLEVHGARQTIGARMRDEPDSMAYVGGGFDARLIALVERSGYATARSILHGVVQRWTARYALRVVRIGPYDDVTNRTVWALDPAVPLFAAKVTGRAR